MSRRNSHLIQVLIQGLFLGIIFTAPINLFYKLTLENAYVRGFFIDYLVPKIYLHDIFILSFIIIGGIYWLINNKRNTANKNLQTSIFNLQSNNLLYIVPLHLVYILLAGVSIIFIIRQFFTINPTASVYWLVKIIEIGLFGFLAVKFFKKSKIINHKLIISALTVTVLFQTALALYQFHFQRSLLPYHYLGETNLSQPVGLAKTTICGKEKVLAYGTTAHPNILAGVVVVYTLLALGLMRHLQINSKQCHPELVSGSQVASVGILKLVQNDNTISLLTTALLIISSIITVALTLSFSAFYGLVFGLLGLVVGKYKSSWLKYLFYLSLGLFFLMPFVIHTAGKTWPDDLSLTRRDLLNRAAVKMWQGYPLVGVGLNNFTAYVEKFSQSNEVVRFPQPAHHVGLLFLAENGVLGIAVIILLVAAHQLKTQNSIRQLADKTQNNGSRHPVPIKSGSGSQVNDIKILNQVQNDKKTFLPIISALLAIASLDHWLISQSVGLVILSLVVILKLSYQKIK